MYKMKALTQSLECVDLNVIDAITLITGTAKSIALINSNTSAMNDLIEAAKLGSSHLDIDFENDFNRHHRRRLAPRRIDETADQEVQFTIDSFYRREFKAVLDTLVNFLNSNAKACMESLKPLFAIFKIPVSRDVLTIDNLKCAVEMFPSNDSRPDIYALQAEMEILFDRCENCKSMSDIMDKALEIRHS